MKERPILFSAPMVCAILDDSKGQTRRIMKHQPPGPDYFKTTCICSTCKAHEGKSHWIRTTVGQEDYSQPFFTCPYGQPGDRLWVKENFKLVDGPDGDRPQFLYQAGMDFRDVPEDLYSEDPVYSRLIDWSAHHSGWRSKLLMPRWASRITLEITGIRVERLTAISGQDAIAEGIESETDNGITTFKDYLTHEASGLAATQSYRTLWESLHGPGSWEANPYVWVVKFKRL